MDIERLKELKQQIKGVHYGINGADLHLLYDLLPLVDEAIARQSEIEKVVCPDCGGSGVYQEYDDEFDRYHVCTCYKCEGTGEIARQSVKSEDVAEAIELFEGVIKYRKDREEEVKKQYGGKLPDFYLDLNKKEALAITALQAYQSTTRKDRTVEEVAISKTETTSAKKITVDVQLRPLLDDLEVDIEDVKEYIKKLD